MNHRKLRCYEVPLETAKRVPALVARMPRGHRHLIDELERALTSAILNLSEGNSRTSAKERARFFDISVASIAESSSAIDIMEALKLIPRYSGDEIKAKLELAYVMMSQSHF